MKILRHECEQLDGPAVYCFTCPDGRRYVGSRNTRDPHQRPRTLLLCVDAAPLSPRRHDL